MPCVRNASRQRLELRPLRVDAGQSLSQRNRRPPGRGQCRATPRRWSGRIRQIALLDRRQHRLAVAGRHDLPQLPLGLRGARQDAPQRPPLSERLDDRLLERKIAQQPEQRLDLCRVGLAPHPRRQHLLAGRLQHGVALVLFDHREVERHAGLAREAVQHAVAEGVDGLDLQPARRLERMGKERAGPPHQRRGGGRRALQRRELCDERRVAGHRPLRQPLRDAAAHLGRRRLGVGEAQHLVRPRPRQQQPQHPRGEHIGLARAGVGRHPHRAGSGRGALPADDRLGHRDRAATALHGSSTPAVSVHSSVRAKWS